MLKLAPNFLFEAIIIIKIEEDVVELNTHVWNEPCNRFDKE